MSNQSFREDPGSSGNRPVIGVVTDGEEAEVYRTILRANDQGLQTLVASPGGANLQKARFVDQLGAEVIPVSGEDTTDGGIVGTLEETARNRGFPGIVIHDRDTPIDIDQSLEQLHESGEYSVPASHETSSTEIGQVIVGIPAYNEEIGIGSVIHAAKELSDEVVVVDDGSTDNTVDVATSAGAEVIVHDENQGKGGAVQTLFQEVRNREFDALVLIDGDGQHLPQEIDQVAEPVANGDADMVVGSRYLEQNDDETPAYRRFGQRVLDILTVGSSSQKLTDTQSGFRAFSRRAVQELDLTTDGIGIESEMVRSADRQGLEMKEVPINVRYDGIDGQTYHPLHHGLAVVTFVLQLVRDRHPLLFFGIPGLVLMIAGALWGIDGILIYRETGNFYPAKAFVSGFVTIIGTLGVFCGLILNRISNMVAKEN